MPTTLLQVVLLCNEKGGLPVMLRLMTVESASSPELIFMCRCCVCGKACVADSRYVILDSAGFGGLGGEVWPHSPAVAAICRGPAASKKHTAGAAHSASHLQPVKRFLLYPW